MVARHKTGSVSGDLPRAYAIMHHVMQGPQAGNFCGNERIVSQQQRVFDQQPHQDLSKSSHQVGARNAEFLLLHCTDSFGSCSTSAIIAPEFLPIISSHLARNLNPYPILHDLPHPFRLYRFNRRPSFSNSPPPQVPRQLLNEMPTQARLRDGVSVSRALQLAMSTGITGKGHDLPLRDRTPLVLKTAPALKDRAIAFKVKQPVIGNMLLSSCPGKKGVSLFYIPISTNRHPPHTHTIVRLTGSVNGRVGVCRDLSRDLERMRSLGVGCIVWYFPISSATHHELREHRPTVVWTT